MSKPTSLAGKSSLMGMNWKLVGKESHGMIGAGKGPRSSQPAGGLSSIPGVDHDTLDLVQRSRIARGVASAPSSPREHPGDGPSPPPAEPSTDDFLESIVKELDVLEGASSALLSAIHKRERSESTVSAPPKQERAATAAPPSITTSSELPTSPLPYASIDTPIVWKADVTSKLTFCLPPELRPAGPSTQDVSTLFPHSHSVSRTFKEDASKPPMRFGATPTEAPAASSKPIRYGAWYVPPEKWSVGMGETSFRATAAVESADDLRRKQLEEQIAYCRAQIPNLDITKQLKTFCVKNYGRAPHYLSSSKK